MPASRLRSVSVKPPSAERAQHVAVEGGSTTTAQVLWFLAAPRIIAGPPMSICSTHSSDAPEATVCSNG